MLFASWLSSLARLSNLSARQGRISRHRREIPLIAIEQLEDRSLLTAPVIAPPSFLTFSENTLAPTTLGAINAYDPDGGMVMLSLSADPIFSLDSSGTLYLQGPFTQPNYSLSVSAMDDEMEMAATLFTISVSDDNNDGIIGDTFTGGGGGDTTTGGGGGDTTTGGGGGDTVVGGGGGGGFPTIPGNQAPDAFDDFGTGFTTDEDTPLTTPNLLANDSDPDGDPISISMIGPSMYGFSTPNSDGTVTYTPMLDWLRPGETRTDTVSYTITDGVGGYDTATFQITITGLNDAPQLAAMITASTESISISFSGTTDAEFDPLTFTDSSSVDIPMWEFPIRRDSAGDLSGQILVTVSDGLASVQGLLDVTFLGDVPEPPDTPEYALPDPPPTDWSSWWNAISKLDITGSSSATKVSSAIASLGTTYALSSTTIPHVTPGDMLPSWRPVKADGSESTRIRIWSSTPTVTVAAVDVSCQKAVPSEVARLQIRANLKYLKQDIVNTVAIYLSAYPPKDDVGNAITLTAAQRDEMANSVANSYIIAVDNFLASHRLSAVPKGANSILTRLNSPVTFMNCENWTSNIQMNLATTPTSSTTGVQSGWLQKRHATHKDLIGSFEHQFVALFGKNRLPPGDDVAGVSASGYIAPSDVTPEMRNSALYLDPWVDMMPRIFLHSEMLTHGLQGYGVSWYGIPR